MWKFIKCSLLAAAGFFIVALLFTLSKLPSPGEIQQALNKDDAGEASQGKRLVPNPEKRSISSNPQDQNQPHPKSSESAQSNQPQNDLQAKGRTLLRKLMDQPPSELRVCDKLANAPGTRPPKGIEEAMGAALNEGAEENPYIESLQAPLGFMLQRPAVKNVFEEIFSLPQEKDRPEGFLEKIGFYGRLAAATADLVANRGTFEMISDRAYHLYILSRLVNKRPDLLGNPLMRDFCQHVQSNIADPDEESFAEERQALLELIEDSNLEPKDLDFDPQARTQIGIQTTKNQFRIGIEQTKSPDT
jgi:hypothetical protein